MQASRVRTAAAGAVRRHDWYRGHRGCGRRRTERGPRAGPGGRSPCWNAGRRWSATVRRWDRGRTPRSPGVARVGRRAGRRRRSVPGRHHPGRPGTPADRAAAGADPPEDRPGRRPGVPDQPDADVAGRRHRHRGVGDHRQPDHRPGRAGRRLRRRRGCRRRAQRCARGALPRRACAPVRRVHRLAGPRTSARAPARHCWTASRRPTRWPPPTTRAPACGPTTTPGARSPSGW
jgi:hypothetical protein